MTWTLLSLAPTPVVRAQQPAPPASLATVGLGIAAAREDIGGTDVGTGRGVAILAGVVVRRFAVELEVHPYRLGVFRASYLLGGRRVVVGRSLYVLPAAGLQYRRSTCCGADARLAIGLAFGVYVPAGRRMRLEPELALRIASSPRGWVAETSGTTWEVGKTLLASLRLRLAHRL